MDLEQGLGRGGRALVAGSAAIVVIAATVANAQTQISPTFAEMRVDLIQLSVGALVVVLIALFWQAARRGLSCLDLITDKGTGKMSLTKVLNLVGGTVGVWTVMRLAIDAKLTWEIFALFLAYCAGTHGYSNYLSAKFRPGEPK